MPGQSVVANTWPARAQPETCLPPPPPLKDVVVRAQIPRGDQQYDTALRYRANFTTRSITSEVRTQLPPLPPGYEAYAPQVFGTPMVTYHVCRICMRPRSDRYHREHPIAPYSVPPPPGICRRCRITSTDEPTEHIEVVKIEESGPVRLGLDCIIPDEDILTLQQVREQMGRGRLHEHVRVVRRVRSTSPSQQGPAKDVKVVYRYVMPRDDALTKANAKVAEVSVENLAALDKLNGQKEPTKEPAHTTDIAELPKPSTALDKIPIEITVRQKQESETRPAPRSGYSESEIRRFARDEVVRYRQAERLVEAHAAPFAHGRLVEVEHRSNKGTIPVQVTHPPPSVRPIEPAPHKKSTFKASKQQEFVPAAHALRPARKELVVDREVRYCHDDSETENPSNAELMDKPARDLPPRVKGNPGASTRDVTNGWEEKQGRTTSAPSSGGKNRTRHDQVTNVSRKPPSEMVDDNIRTSTQKNGRQDEHATRLVTVVRETEPAEQRRDTSSKPTNRSYKRDNGQEHESRILIVREVTEDNPQAPATRSLSSRSMYRAFAEAKDGPIDHKSKSGDSSSNRHSTRRNRDVIDVLAKGKSHEGEYVSAVIQAPLSSRISKSTTRPSSVGGVHSVRHDYNTELDVLHESSISPKSDWTDREYWKDGCTVKTASRHSRVEPLQPARSVRHDALEEAHAGAAKKPIHDARCSWNVDAIETSRLRAVEASSTTRSGRESGHSYNTNTKAGGEQIRQRSPREQPGAGFEYEYREHTTQPANRPLGSQPFDDSPPVYVHESETLYTYKPRIMNNSATTSSAFKRKPGLSTAPEIPGNSSLSQVPSKSSMRSPGSKSARMREYYDQNGDKMTQVRFANKVVFSPTPPASDDILPSADKRKDRSDARRSERRHGHIDVEQTYEVRARPLAERGRSSGKSESERASQTAVNQHKLSPVEGIDVPVDKPKALTRALSESPSREVFMREHCGKSGQERERRRPDGLVDRYGPYRTEVQDDSMIAACGSSSGPQPGTMREV